MIATFMLLALLSGLRKAAVLHAKQSVFRIVGPRREKESGENRGKPF